MKEVRLNYKRIRNEVYNLVQKELNRPDPEPGATAASS